MMKTKDIPLLEKQLSNEDIVSVKVIFRKWPNGDIIALFPELPFDNMGYLCECYEHVGQHGCADPAIVYRTKLAKPEEYEDLYNELTHYCGYDLQVIKRIPRNALATRRKILEEMDATRKEYDKKNKS